MPEKVGERTSSRAGLTPAVDHHLVTAHPDCPLLEENRLHSLTRSKTLQGQSPRYKLGNPTRDRSSRNCGVRLITSICDPAERAYARHDPRMPAPVTDDRGQPLIARDPSGYDASLQWAASPGAIAYHVYWRDAGSSDWERDQIVGNTTHFVSTMLRLMISSSESRRSVLTVTRASLAPMSLPTGYSATFGQLRTLPIARDLALVFDGRPERRDQFIELFGQFREGAVQFLTKPFRERDSAVSLQHDRAAREQQNNRRKSTN